MRCYRIVTDSFSGYEVQVKKRFLFWTWWKQCHHYFSVNSFRTIEDAKNWIDYGLPKYKEKDKDIVWITEGCK